MRIGLIAVLALALVGCSGPPGSTPAPTDDPILATCDADVAAAALNDHEITALDAAIRDCQTVDRLQTAISRHPGFLSGAVTTPAEFVGRRCEDASAGLASTGICVALGRKPA